MARTAKQLVRGAVAVAAHMGYKGGGQACENCFAFRCAEEVVKEGDEAIPDRCTFNAAFWFPVDRGGRCDFYAAPRKGGDSSQGGESEPQSDTDSGTEE